jgi:hypothetical protein
MNKATTSNAAISIIRLIIYGAFCVLTSTRVMAQDDRWKSVLLEAGRSAGKTAGSEGARLYLNANVKQIGSLQFAALGTTVVSAAQLGLAINDFSKAKTDKDKYYASLNATAAAIGYINPVAGIAAQAALLATKLAESGLQLAHSQKMLTIYKTVFELATETGHIFDLRIQSLNAYLKELTRLTQESERAVTETQNLIQIGCHIESMNESLSLIEACLTASVIQSENNQILIAHVDAMLRAIQYADIAELQKPSGDVSGKNGLLEIANASKLNLIESRKLILAGLEEYSRLVTEAVLEKSKEQAVKLQVIALAHDCIHTAIDYASEVDHQISRKIDRSCSQNSLQRQSEVIDLQYKGATILSRNCGDLKTERPDLDRLLLNTFKNVQVASAKTEQMAKQNRLNCN